VPAAGEPCVCVSGIWCQQLEPDWGCESPVVSATGTSEGPGVSSWEGHHPWDLGRVPQTLSLECPLLGRLAWGGLGASCWSQIRGAGAPGLWCPLLERVRGSQC